MRAATTVVWVWRAVAVLSVVAFHAFPAYLPGGFIGVDIFFVISGFLISGLLFRDKQFSFVPFYQGASAEFFQPLSSC